ncbi:hypothetical protein BD560DRAFT_427469 [Blakeslea trispora]|nr:hypothetical protein BD560DRAFT_427469 [Blakeslea trispora]
MTALLYLRKMSIKSINTNTKTRSSLKPFFKSTYTRQASFVRPHVHTITQTDYVYSTIIIPTLEPEPQPTTPNPIESVILPIDDDGWEQHVLPFLPTILAFAVIGLLALMGCLVYSTYRASQACQTKYKRHQRNSKLDFNRKQKKLTSPISVTLSNIIPKLAIPSPRYPTISQDEEMYQHYHPHQQEPIRFDKSDIKYVVNSEQSENSSYSRRPSLPLSLLAKILPGKFARGSKSSIPQSLRHKSLPIVFASTGSSIDNLNIPISSTFVPIDKTSLTLVPRSEIWLDPHRRRGVDELDIWERKYSSTTPTENQTVIDSEPKSSTPMWRFPSQEAYPDSPESFERRLSMPLEAQSHLKQPQTVSPGANTKSSSSCATTVSQDRHNTESEDDHHFEDFPIVVRLPKSQKEQQGQAAWEIQMAREALQTSRLANSSSQWLTCSRSQSL